jgi:thiamine-monophosphate kinase
LNTFVLGGDTNQGKELFLSGCALGRVPKESTVTRKGAQPGDKLFLTGPAGIGNVFAFLRFTGKNNQLKKSFYQPVARIEEGKGIKEFVSCCMDTSDGIIHTMDTLMRLNRCGFILYSDWDRIVHPVALDVCRAQNIPPWLVLAGVHGEFELLFSAGADTVQKLHDEAAQAGWNPVLIGEVTSGKGIRIKAPDRSIPLDTAQIRNFSYAAGSEPEQYIKKLFDIARTVGI